MQGNIAQSFALVCVGNAYLHGRDVSGFWPNASVFRFSKLCDFGVDDPAQPASYRVIAADPLAWLASLRPNTTGLRLHAVPATPAPTQVPGIEERMLVGFVGGGPRWLIEAVGETRSTLWQAFDRLLDRNDSERKIWANTYIPQGETEPQNAPSTPLDLAARDALDTVIAFAAKAAPGWDEYFRKARSVWEEGAAPNDDLTTYADIDPMGLRLLAMVQHAWAFGGMGSWNDIGFTEAAQQSEYENVSERLFRALIAAIVAVANSTFVARSAAAP
ncbi:MAG: hypothetical protein ABUS48_04555 [Pseudomonadota bacterium]